MSKKTVYMIAAAVLVLSAIGELCGVHLHSPAWWPLPFGYDIFFGFFGCWLLIILAKIIMDSRCCSVMKPTMMILREVRTRVICFIPV